MSDVATIQTAVVAGLAGAALLASFRDIRWFTFAWAAVFPIEEVTGVPGWVFDGLRYGGAVWVVLRVRSDLPEPARPLLRNLGLLLLALAAVRGLMAVVNHDNPNIRFAVMLAAGTVLAYLVALRTTVHRAVIAGYLAGIGLSALVSLTQALHWDTIAPANREGSRYPGLSTYNAVFSWHVATGLIVGTYLLASRYRRRDQVFWLAAVVTPLCALGLLTNGAQGGLIGVVAAGVAVAWAGRNRITRNHIQRALAVAAGLVVLAVGAVAAGVDAPSVTDYDSSLTNEKARVESWERGFEEMLNNPITGMASDTYIDDLDYEIVPHFLPLESGAMAGVVGFVVAAAVVLYLGWLVIRGPADRSAVTLAAYGVLASLLVNTVTEPQGPFQGASRAVPLFLIVLYASVGQTDPVGAPASDPDPRPAPGGPAAAMPTGPANLDRS